MKSETAAKYLKAILQLKEQNGEVRSAMLATEMNVKRPTVCVALQQLQNDGYIQFEADHEICLTESGEEIARKVMERYRYFCELFLHLGITPQIAEKDACILEFALSDETFSAFQEKIHASADDAA